MPTVGDIRMRAATRAVALYFCVFFVLALFLGALSVYAVTQSRAQRHDSYKLRVEYCMELEKVKTDNRADVARDIANFPRTLRLLRLKDTPELRDAARQGWQRRLSRNAPRACPYSAP